MEYLSLNSKAGKWLMASSILATAMAFIDGSALNVVLPSLQKDLDASSPDIFWILNSYLVVLGAFILPGGALGDKLGKKQIFMTGIAIFTLSSIACGLSGSVLALTISRALQGAGGALMIPGSLALITTSINEKERGNAIGTWSAITTMVSVGGPIIGGLLADYGLWRYIFFINVPIGVVSLWILYSKVEEKTDSARERTKVDVKGAVALAAGLALITYGMLNAPVIGFKDPRVYISLNAGVLVLFIFFWLERTNPYAMVPPKLFANRVFSGLNGLTLLLYAGLSGGMLFLGLNLVQVQGYSQLESGLTFLPFTVLMIGFSRSIGKLSDRYGAKRFLIAGPFITGAAFLYLSFIEQTAGPAAYWTSYFPGIIGIGIGMTLTVAPLTTSVMSSLGNAYAGTASGINNAASRIANILANAVFGAFAVAVFTSSLSASLHSGELKLNSTQMGKIMQQAVNLGNAQVPSGLSEVQGTAVHSYYSASFVDAYQNVLLCCAALGFTASLLAFLFLKKRSQTKSTEPVLST